MLAGSNQCALCPATRIPTADRCYLHLNDIERDNFIASLSPGRSLDLSGTDIPISWLPKLLRAFRNKEGVLEFGAVDFQGVTFALDDPASEDPNFEDAHFRGEANFAQTKFTRHARFRNATFHANASFSGMAVTEEAQFHATTFKGSTDFTRCTFSGVALFSGSRFEGKSTIANFSISTFYRPALFDGSRFFVPSLWNEVTFADQVWFEHSYLLYAQFVASTFKMDASFANTTFQQDLNFERSTFGDQVRIGPMTVGDTAHFNGAIFNSNPFISIAARRVMLDDVRLLAGGSIHVRYAEITLERASIESSTILAFDETPFRVRMGVSWLDLDESIIKGNDIDVRAKLLSLRNTDVANLTISGLDLRSCIFAEAHRLDKLSLENGPVFQSSPRNWIYFGRSIPILWRWSYRQTIVEEHFWRSAGTKSSGWSDISIHPLVADTEWAKSRQPPAKRSPSDLVATYRDLRRAQEDEKNEPGAADFYYGEMEMRRQSSGSKRGEKSILRLYWLLSGYGLRASRALAALAAVLAATIIALTLFGLPNVHHDQRASGQVRQDSNGTNLSIDLSPSADSMSGPLSERWSQERVQKSAEVALDAVVFRGSNEQLTTVGTVTDMAARFVGPVLLALAALAVRSRVKR